MKAIMEKTCKIGFLLFNLLVFASFAFAALPSDLTFTANKASASVGEEFVVRLQISPPGTPVDPFKNYSNVSVDLPANINNISESLYQDLSAYNAGTIFTWHLNSTGAGISQINVTVDGVNTSSVSIDINGPVVLPVLAADVPNIADNQIVGNSIPVTILVTNSGGNASNINGYLISQKSSLNATTFSIPSIPSMGSASLHFLLNPSQYGNGSLLIGFSNYKRSDSVLVSAGDSDFNATGDSDSFYINSDPNVNFGSLKVTIGPSKHDSSVDLDNYISDSDTALASLNWSCNSTNSNLTVSVSASHIVNISAADGIYSGSLSCYVSDGVASDSDSFIVNVDTFCTESWSCDLWGSCQSDSTQARTCTDSNACGTAFNKPAESQSCSYTAPSSGGGSRSHDLASKSFNFGSLKSGSVTLEVLDSAISISDVEFFVLKNLNDVHIKIEEIIYLPQAITAPKGPVYQYLYFTLTNINDSDIDHALISFDVKNRWLSDIKIDKNDIVLMRYHEGKWDELPTRIVSSDLSKVYFKAMSPGLSYFAIAKRSEIAEDVIGGVSGEEGKAAEGITENTTESVNEEESKETTKTEQKNESITEGTNDEVKKTSEGTAPKKIDLGKYLPVIIIVGVSAIIVLVSVVVIYRKLKK